MTPADTTIAEVATFTVLSASTGKVYVCGVTVDVAAGRTRHYGGPPTSCSSSTCCTPGSRCQTRARSR